MSVQVRINGREFTLSWSEFEKVSARIGLTTCIDILAIRGGGAYVAA